MWMSFHKITKSTTQLLFLLCRGRGKNCKNCSVTKCNVNLMPTTGEWLREEI